jgi:hypothetical protein
MGEQNVDEPTGPVACLERLSARISRGETPPRLEIEQALEAGFGSLIALEAELQRAKRPSKGSDRAEATCDEVLRQIERLSTALTQLRTVSSSPGQARVGYGFVLPTRARER